MITGLLDNNKALVALDVAGNGTGTHVSLISQHRVAHIVIVRHLNFIKENNEAYYDEEATAYINNTRTGGDDPGGAIDKDSFDPMCIDALRHVILSGSASISMIQRKCSVGYNRAGNIIEWMEDNHYISPFDGAKARKVLITKEEFESEFGPL